MATDRRRVALLGAIALGVATVALALRKPADRAAPSAPDAGANVLAVEDADAALALAARDDGAREGEGEGEGEGGVEAWDGLVGDASAPSPAPPRDDVRACAEADATRRSALDAWIAREAARLAPKKTDARMAKLIERRLAIVRDVYLAGYMPVAATQCATTKAGRFDVVWERFDGTIAADQPLDPMDGPLPDDDTSLRFFDLAIHGRATLRFRAASGEERAVPLEAQGRDAYRFDMGDQGTSGAAVAWVTYLTAGEGDEGPLALLHVERGRVDVIDANPQLSLVTPVFAVRGAAIVRSQVVPRNLTVVDLRDVDGDGRSDLLTPGPFEAMVPNVHDTPVPDHGPLLLAHAGPKGYALDDGVARAYAVRVCPVRPTRLVLPLGAGSPGAPDDAPPFWLSEHRAEALARVVCARLWGLSRASLEAAGLPAFLTHWVSVRPPLSLGDQAEPPRSK
jgi:hypothetical protein